MSTAGLPRHLLKWVLSLDLTYPIKHPKRDFANGFLVAEVLSKYFPDDVQMHSFENVTSIERKKSNWHLMKKFFKRYDVPVSKDDVDQVMAAADGAIVKLLQTIYDYVHEDPAAQGGQQYEEQDPQYCDPNTAPVYGSPPSAMQQAVFAPVASPEYMQPGSLPYMQQPYTQSQPAAYQPQQQSPGTSYPSGAGDPYSARNAYSPGEAYSSGNAYSHPGVSQQAAPGNWPQQYPMGMQQYPMPMQQQQYPQQAYSAGMPQQMQGANALPQQMMAPAVQFAAPYQAESYAGEQGVGGGMPSIEYGKRPRAVDYKPYTQQDYNSRNYDAKTQKEYWKLGTLGPQIEDEDLQAKRKKAEELKELARSIREKNARLASMSAATSRPKVETPKGKSAREKALEFARNVPRPEMKRAASTGSSSGESTPKQQQQSSGMTEIERLQAQHAAHRKKVESIRQEFVRMATD